MIHKPSAIRSTSQQPTSPTSIQAKVQLSVMAQSSVIDHQLISYQHQFNSTAGTITSTAHQAQLGM
jgi:hypothetical protein